MDKNKFGLILIVVGLLLMVGSATSFMSIMQNSILTNGDFSSGTSNWWLDSSLAGNTFTTDSINGIDGAYGKLVCTDVSEGYVAVTNSFTVTPSETYMVSFKYKSAAWFEVYVVCMDDVNIVDYWGIVCHPRDTWTEMFFIVGPMPSVFGTGFVTWVDFRTTVENNLEIDDVSIVKYSDVMPTPTPTASPSPAPTLPPDTNPPPIISKINLPMFLGGVLATGSGVLIHKKKV